MTPAIAGLGIAAAIYAASQAPAEAPGAGKRVDIDSYTNPREVTRCIAYNINRKMPELRVRSRAAESPDEGGYLILTAAEPETATFGVIRVDRSETGSHLTTWLPERSLAAAAPEALARKLVAGC